MKYSTGNCGDLPIGLTLQQGVWVEIPDTVTASTVSGFISHLLNVTPQEFTEKIKTIMVNNQVVDAPESTPVRSGDTLILSGAMPGLVGAMLRCDSPIGVMRASITASGAAISTNSESGRVRIKLFNTVLRDYGEQLLKYGFYLEETAS